MNNSPDECKNDIVATEKNDIVATEKIHEYTISFKVFGTEAGTSKIARGLGAKVERVDRINNPVVT